MIQPMTDTVTTASAANDDAEMFDLAPVSLWLEDYSGLRSLLETWRAEGVTDLRVYLRDDLERVKACSSRIRLIKVNAKTCRCSARTICSISSTISAPCSATTC
jgi:hypothetical protein